MDPIASYGRDNKGDVVFTIKRDTTHIPMHEVNVPTLGVIVDSFLDAWGYESDLITILHDNFRRAKSGEEFVQGVATTVPQSEALWYWHHIEVHERPRMRVRNIPWIELREAATKRVPRTRF